MVVVNSFYQDILTALELYMEDIFWLHHSTAIPLCRSTTFVPFFLIHLAVPIVNVAVLDNECVSDLLRYNPHTLD